MKLVTLAVLLAPTAAAFQGCPVVMRSGCSSRALPVSAIDRPALPSTPLSVIATPLVTPARHSSPRNAIRRVIGGLRTALLIGAAGVFMRAPGAPTALAAKAPPKPTTTKAAPNTAMTSFLTTAAMGGGLVYWSIRVASEEDREEQERIKSESEKEKSLAKEYTDIDGGVTVDEDLMASLRSRMGNSTEASSGEEPGGSAPEEPPTPPPAPLGGGGSAVLDAPPPAEDPPTASDADIERLKRMFGGPDADKS